MKLNGNKTYLVAAGTVVFSVLGVALGQFDVQHAVELVLSAGALVGVRSAIKKIE